MHVCAHTHSNLSPRAVLPCFFEIRFLSHWDLRQDNCWLANKPQDPPVSPQPHPSPSIGFTKYTQP